MLLNNSIYIYHKILDSFHKQRILVLIDINMIIYIIEIGDEL